jgi:Carboxypeptidase regulatory-like domain/TonB dependent receptor-like, beta-barrel
MFRALRVSALVGLASLTSLATLSAQTTFATITGTVRDPSGAAIANATVTATHSETGVVWTVTSNKEGVYSLLQLREGLYTVAVEAAGFKRVIASDVALVARDIRRLDVAMELGTVESRVDVTGGATLIEAETPRISDTRTADQLKTLPLNDRGIWAFLQISPMMMPRNGSYSFAGSRTNQSQFAIDGTTMSDGVTENAIGPLANYPESFQEVKLDLANNSAEFPALGQVTIISKSGTNGFNGSLFDYYQSPIMRAREPFATARRAGVQHNIGLSAGGPLSLPQLYDGRNRTFWFVSGETFTGSAASADLNPTVPLEAWRRGDFSALGVQIRNPFTGDVYSDGRIPASAINPVALKIQERFYPLPNTGDTSKLAAANYRATLPRDASKPYYMTSRLDHNFGASDRLYARFTFHQTTNPVWEGNLPAFGERNQFRQNKAVTFSYTKVIGSSLVNEVRYGYVYNNNPVSGPLNGPEVVNSLGLTGLAPNLPDIGGVYKLSFGTTGLTGLSQLDWSNPGFLNRANQIQEQLTYMRGTHTLKGGLELRNVSYDEAFANANLFGFADFTNRYSAVPGVAGSGHAYADFLFGVPTTAARAFPPITAERRRWNYDFFVQDDWKLTPRLTMNLGLRYDYHAGWTEQNGQMASFDVATGQIVVPDNGISNVSPLMPASYVKVVPASSLGLPSDTILRPDRNNLAPRIGVAYKPFHSGDTVLRGGYGIYYDMTPLDPLAASVPFVINEVAFTNTPTPTVVWPQAFPAAGGAGPSSIALPRAINPDLKMPYSHQWNVTVEHQRWNTGFRASYVGTAGRSMWYQRDINSPVPDGRLYIEKSRPFPQYPAINYVENGARHDYRAFTLEGERRMKNGLFVQLSYTAARDIGNTNEWSNTIENPFDLDRELGHDQATPTHRFTSAVMYDLPFGRNRRWMSDVPTAVDLALGGWQVSMVGYLQSGLFLTPTITIPDPTGTRFTASASRPNVSFRPDQLRDAAVSDPSINQWFDPTAFAAPGLGLFGTAARGSILGPGLNVWHAGLHKTFHVSAHQGAPIFRLELTSTNVFNHPQWANPSTNVTSTNVTAGKITNTGGPTPWQQAGARTLRLGVRAEW